MSDENQNLTISFTKAARKIREVLDKTQRACSPSDPDRPRRGEKVKDLTDSGSR